MMTSCSTDRLNRTDPRNPVKMEGSIANRQVKNEISQCRVLNPYPGDVNTAKSRIGDGGECRWGHIDVGYFASGAAVGDGQRDTLALDWEKRRSDRLISI